jgi:DNA uptake protein ComE-like DNA-binding protein
MSALGIAISSLLAAEETAPKVKEAAEKTTEATKEAAEKVVDATKKGAEAAKEKTEEAGKAVKKAAEKTAEATKEKASDAKKKLEGKSDEKLSEEDAALVANAKKSASALTPSKKKKLLEVLNTGDDKALRDLPGIGPVKAISVKKARPYKAVEDLVLVDGIGQATFDEIVKSAAADPKKDVKPEAKEAAPKKPAARKD